MQDPIGSQRWLVTPAPSLSPSEVLIGSSGTQANEGVVVESCCTAITGFFVPQVLLEASFVTACQFTV